MMEEVKMISEIRWYDVDEKLPTIPKGKYGISVLVITFDPVFNECKPGFGCEVYEMSYAATAKRSGEILKPWIDTNLDFDFMMISHNKLYEDSIWVPSSDRIIYWAYMPVYKVEVIVPVTDSSNKIILSRIG